MMSEAVAWPSEATRVVVGWLLALMQHGACRGPMQTRISDGLLRHEAGQEP